MKQAARSEVLTTADEARWQQTLAQIDAYDFCHQPAFSRLAEECGQGEARLLAVQDGDVTIAFPLLLRDIPGTTRRDVTSVYGYAGPVASTRAIPEDTRRTFLSFVEGFLREQQVVSAFSRLHPLLEQPTLLGGLGDVIPVGWTLSLDLTGSEQEQRAGYRRNHRQDVKKLQELGVTCAEAGEEQLDAFIAMYYRTMDRVGAAPEYYFGRDYFAHMLTDMPEVTHLFMCAQDGVPIAGGIFTICRGIVQWYFSGTSGDYAGPPPTKLLFDIARQWANAAGAHTLHLGGGVGGRRDSLYHFKAGFTHREHVYSTWRHIVDPVAYEELCRAAGAPTNGNPEGAYFPLYRLPAFEVCSERTT
jgi:hypothetical protein